MVQTIRTNPERKEDKPKKREFDVSKVKGLDRLTPKQAIWIREYYRTGNATKAAMIAYNCKDKAGAAQMGWRNKKLLNEPITTLAEQLGIDAKFLLEALKMATRAVKVDHSHTEPDMLVPDWQARLKALQVLGKWMGMEVSASKTIPTQVHVKINADLLKETEGRVSQLRPVSNKHIAEIVDDGK